MTTTEHPQAAGTSSGEGLPDPSLYRSQLKNCSDQEIRAIMRGNLAGFLGLPD